MTKHEYNGWTNYETWVVNLWMGNDQGSYLYWQETANECWNETFDSKRYNWESQEQHAVRLLSDRLKDEHENASQDILDNAKQSASVWADLLSAALSEVNWREIAEHLIEDVDKTEQPEETEA